MTDDAELVQQLRRDMDRATRDIRVPPGLAGQAYRHGRRRHPVRRAATAAGAAAAVAAVGVVVAGVTGLVGSRASHQPAGRLTTAYVLTRIEHALNALNSANLVLREKLVFTPPTPLLLIPFPNGPTGIRPPDYPYLPFSEVVYPFLGGPRTWVPGTARMSYTLLWSYRSTETARAFTASGRSDYEVQYKVGQTRRQGVAGGSFFTAESATAVIYGNKTWWSESDGVDWIPYVDCTGGPGRPAPNWPAAIRQGLACGAYKVAGRQVIGGIRAIKLVEYVNDDPYQTLWVSSATYLPIRAAEISHVAIDYQWLRPTPATLAHLRMPVPGGFRKVAPPKL
jgi:hypothetical protein